MLKDSDNIRKAALLKSVRKSTNLYRRVSTVNYRNVGKFSGKNLKLSASKCIVCLVTLVKSNKDQQRSGIKLSCYCNVRVCITCFKHNPGWYLTEPHFTKCSTLKGFFCTACACFEGFKEKVCCIWMCSRCSSERQNPDSLCSKCSRRLDGCSKRQTRNLWRWSNKLSEEPVTSVTYSEERIADYRDLIRSQVFSKVYQSRHLSASDIRILFHECFNSQVCTCNNEPNSMCTSCTPVLSVMELLAKNPRPLIASFAERAIPGRNIARNVYDKALLIDMLNDQDLPLCINQRSCKGNLVYCQHNPEPLTSLITLNSYNKFVASRTATGEAPQINPSSCILCLLFNQSSAVAHIYSSDGLQLETCPNGPVYYFNVKLSPDVGVPEVCIDERHGHLVNFQGSVGSYKPTFYYNWKDLLHILRKDNSGKITFLPSHC